MDTPTQHGYLLLADISGYTSYLAGVELDHANEILTDLLDTIVGRIKTILTIVKLEGDAVFAYTPDGKLPRGETLLELIDATYAAFRDRRDTVHRRTTCTCAACRAIPALDLKFLVHHGDFIVQNISSIRELVGSDVNLAHRLMKNHVTEITGWKAYALFSAQALMSLTVNPESLHPQIESYEHLGDVQTYSLNLRERYEAITAARHMFVAADEADYVLIQDFPAAPPIVWEWLTDMQMRNTWSAETGAVWSIIARPNGRYGPGARNHCAHGKGTSEETILDWRPFDYLSSETRGGGTVLLETMQLEPLPGGNSTRLHNHIKVVMPLPQFFRQALMKFTMKKMKYAELFEKSARLLTEELQRREDQIAS